MNWRGFAAGAPELAALGEQSFEQSALCLLGTLRKDGSPRISPCEVYIVDGELMLGMMWQSKKALDLLRDPRLAVHTVQCDREAKEGDLKLYGRAVEVTDSTVRERHADAQYAKIQWRPDGLYHLFSLDIESAGYVRFGEGRKVLRWSTSAGFERIPHPDD